VARALGAVNAAIGAGAAALRPGALGHEVDACARQTVVEAGYPEYMHALGHQVGRRAHDGGAILGPQWERYGTTPSVPVREGEVYTLELGVLVEGRGYLGIEEMAVVTADGCRFLTERQTEMPLLA
jgi:Xaa-Pro aminopeptidase